MYINGHIEVTIAGKLLQTIVEVDINNDVAQIGANCDITVPLTCRIQNEGQYLIDDVRNVFKSGDEIEIYAWYDGYDRQLVFKGFVYDFFEGTPLKIRCLDYVYKLRQGTLNKSWASTTLKDVVEYILTGTGITLMTPYANFDLTGFTIANQSPAAALEMIKNDLKFLVITLIDKELYVNVSSNTLNTVELKTDKNVIACQMQKPDAAYKKFKVQVSIKKTDGTKEIVEVGDADGEIRECKLFSVVTDKKGALKHGQDALQNIQLGHYNGKITTLLYPNCNLFDAIDYTDIRYPARSAIYTVRALNITLNKEGFRREITTAYLRAK